MKITFLNGVREVTGSCHLLECLDKRILFDCGMKQGVEKKDHLFHFDPRLIDYVLLSHAHIDHSGLLPLLTLQGFSGTIYSTPATRDVAKILLLDSAKIQKEELNLPLYTEEDVYDTLNLFECYDYEQEFNPIHDIAVTFKNAGHILGSAITSLDVQDTQIVCSGDLGNGRSSLLNPPARIDKTDYLIIESTYGDKLHSFENFDKKLVKIINDAITEKGRVLIPVFAVGRAQEVLYHLNRLRQASKFPEIPIYFDTPMGTSVMDLYLQHAYCLRADFRDLFLQDKSIFNFKGVKFVKSQKESMNKASSDDPAIILAASGMLEGGRILNYLNNIISSENSCIIFVGFQATGTLGSIIQHEPKKIPLKNGIVQRKCKIRTVSGLSAHADYNNLLEFINNFELFPRKIFIVHGEEKSSLFLRDLIRNKLKLTSIVPQIGETFQISGEMVVQKNTQNVMLECEPEFYKLNDGVSIAPFFGGLVKERGNIRLISLEQYHDIIMPFLEKMQNLSKSITLSNAEISHVSDETFPLDEWIKTMNELNNGILSKRKIRSYIEILKTGGGNMALFKRLNQDLQKDRLGLDIKLEERNDSVKKFCDYFKKGLMIFNVMEIIAYLGKLESNL